MGGNSTGDAFIRGDLICENRCLHSEVGHAPMLHNENDHAADQDLREAWSWRFVATARSGEMRYFWLGSGGRGAFFRRSS